MVRSMCHVVFRLMLIENRDLGQSRSHRWSEGFLVASEMRRVWTLAGVSVGQKRIWVRLGSS